MSQFLPDRSLSHLRTTITGSFWHVTNRISSIISPLVMVFLESGFRLLLSKFFFDEILSTWQSSPGYRAIYIPIVFKSREIVSSTKKWRVCDSEW